MNIPTENHLLLNACTRRESTNIGSLQTRRAFRCKDCRIPCTQGKAIGEIAINLCITLVVRCAEQRAELVIRPRNDTAEISAEFLAQIFINPRCRNRNVQPRTIERFGGCDVHDSANTSRLQAWLSRFIDLCGLNDVRGENIERKLTAIIISGQRATVQEDSVEFRAKTANRDELSFTARTVNRDAGDTLKRFSNVGVGKLANVFSRNRVNYGGAVALQIDRILQALAETCDDDCVLVTFDSFRVVLRISILSNNGGRNSDCCKSGGLGQHGPP